MVEINLNGLSRKQLKEKLEMIKLSDADIETKEHNIKRIEEKLYGNIMSDSTAKAYKDFLESQADIDDLKV